MSVAMANITALALVATATSVAEARHLAAAGAPATTIRFSGIYGPGRERFLNQISPQMRCQLMDKIVHIASQEGAFAEPKARHGISKQV